MTEDSSDTKKTRYQRYIEEISEDIGETIQQFGCQPILFVGSGLSRRYFGAPSWDELLSILADSCSKVDKKIAFYKQSFSNFPAIGEEFARLYHEWAWTDGNNEFPPEMFDDDVPKESYLKFKISEIISNITPLSINELAANEYIDEITSLQKIRPHAIITTNYDRMIEILFPDHHPVIGQMILQGISVTIGEIFKIHGCISDSQTLVFTQSDYEEFAKRKKFLSAKLMTFFSEHPLIFIGYSANDPNIRSILSDIDQALPEKGGLIPNIYILEWDSEIDDDSNPPKEKVLPTEEDRTVRVKLIRAKCFRWVFDAFAANPALNNVNPRVLRALIARSYDLVRHDIPKMKIEADFQMLNDAVGDSDKFATLFGLANVSKFSAASATHPFSATEVGAKLGGKTWHITNQMIDKLTRISGKKSIKSYDNRYHIRERLNTSTIHRYSQEAVDLLLRVRDNAEYSLIED